MAHPNWPKPGDDIWMIECKGCGHGWPLLTDPGVLTEHQGFRYQCRHCQTEEIYLKSDIRRGTAHRKQ